MTLFKAIGPSGVLLPHRMVLSELSVQNEILKLRMQLLEIASSYFGKCESKIDVLVSSLPYSCSKHRGSLSAPPCSLDRRQAAWKELATSWALHNLLASEKRGFPPTYFQPRIRDNEVLSLEYHLDFCVIFFQEGISDCPLKHKYGDKILDRSLV